MPLSQHQKEQRMASVKPKLNEFFGYVGSIIAEVSGKSLLGTSVSYALSMHDDRMVYIMDGRLNLSNNICERESMKPFVIGRKNWLFANTNLNNFSQMLLASIISSIECRKSPSFVCQIIILHYLCRRESQRNISNHIFLLIL